MGRKMLLGTGKKNDERVRQQGKSKSIGRPRKCNHPHVPPVEDCPPSEEPITPAASVDTLKGALNLPPHWVDHTTGLSKIVEGQNGSEVTRCLQIDTDFTWKVYVHGREVNQHSSCSAIGHISHHLDVTSLQQLVDTIDRCKVCSGNSEEQYVSLLEARKGSILSHNGDVSAILDRSTPFLHPVVGDVSYITVRSSQCAILTANSKCEMCRAYRKNLRAITSRINRVSSPDKRKRVDASSHTNYRYLRSPELAQRLKNSRSQNKVLSRQVKDLKRRIDEMVQSSGVTLDETLNSDMCGIVNEKNGSIGYPPDSFAGVFWDQQRESMLKNPKQMRWHPMMIKWCMHLKMISSACYNSIRSSGVLKLPSERTLRDYTNIIKAKSGLQRDVDEQLMKEADIDHSAGDHKRFVALLFDEVKIKEDLVYNKHTGEMIGFINVTDINQCMLNHEQSCLNQEEKLKPKLATHMLVFMVRGICSSLEFAYAQFPVSSASGDILHPIVWECVEHLEMIGLKVLAFVCDGASCNRKFYKMHDTGKEEKCNYKVKNVYADEDRPIFLISDIPHLIKTTRNSWANSYGHSRSKQLWINGQDISWQHLVKLYERHCSVKHAAPGLTILHKIKYEHIYLNSYSKMRVDLAAQVLSTTVACALDHEDNANLCETARFVRKFDRFFDCMNVRNFVEAHYNRKPDLEPYRDPNDDRLSWLENDFLAYLDEWKDSVEGCRALKSKKEKSRAMLAKETRVGLHFTVKAVVGLVKYCLSIPGVKCVLTEHLNQDPLEAFFGRQRMSCGRNDNPNVDTFLHNTVSLRVQGSAALKPFRGNCRRGKRPAPIPLDNTPLKKRRKSDK